VASPKPAPIALTYTRQNMAGLSSSYRRAVTSVAAIKVSGMASVPGWNVWRVPSRGNRYFAEIRDDFYQAQASSEAVEGSGGDAS